MSLVWCQATFLLGGEHAGRKKIQIWVWFRAPVILRVATARRTPSSLKASGKSCLTSWLKLRCILIVEGMEQGLGKKSSLRLRENFRMDQKGKLVMRSELLRFQIFLGMQYFYNQETSNKNIH